MPLQFEKRSSHTQGQPIQRRISSSLVICSWQLCLNPLWLKDYGECITKWLFSALLHSAHHLVVPTGLSTARLLKVRAGVHGWGWGAGWFVGCGGAVGGERAEVYSCLVHPRWRQCLHHESVRILENAWSGGGGGVAMALFGGLDVSGGRGGAVGGWEGGGFGRLLNGFWEKAGMEWWVSIDGNVSVSLLSHLWILPTPSHPFLFAIKRTTKKATAWSQQGILIRSNALYVSQIHIKIRCMETPGINPLLPAKSIVFQSYHLSFITPQHLNTCKEPLL